MFTKSAHIYDAIYSFVDYESEASLLQRLINEHKRSPGRDVLDVACGTGQHISFLQRHFNVEGLDLEVPMLDIARSRNPGVAFHHGNMIDFDLQRQFDAVLCMFSSIGFVRTVENLRKTAISLARHVKPGGVLIVEPWVHAASFIDGHLGSRFVDLPDLKIARVNTSTRVGDISKLHLHYMVGTKEGIEYFSEDHELGLFTNEEYLSAFHDAELQATFHSSGPKTQELYNRGLYIATRP